MYIKKFESFGDPGEYIEISNHDYVILRRKMATVEISDIEKLRLKSSCSHILKSISNPISDIKINNAIISSISIEIGYNTSVVHIRKCEDEWWLVTCDISHFGRKHINKQILKNFKCDGFESVINLLSSYLIPYCKKIMSEWS